MLAVENWLPSSKISFSKVKVNRKMEKMRNTLTFCQRPKRNELIAKTTQTRVISNPDHKTGTYMTVQIMVMMRKPRMRFLLCGRINFRVNVNPA